MVDFQWYSNEQYIDMYIIDAVEGKFIIEQYMENSSSQIQCTMDHCSNLAMYDEKSQRSLYKVLRNNTGTIILPDMLLQLTYLIFF